MYRFLTETEVTHRPKPGMLSRQQRLRYVKFRYFWLRFQGSLRQKASN